MKKFLLITILSLIFLLYSTDVFAIDQGIGIYPPIIKIKADPGSEIKVPIRVKNLTDNQLETEINMRPFSTSDNGDVSLILHKDYTPENSSILRNVTLLETAQKISKTIFSPQEEKILSLRIKIDKEEKQKDYYFSIVFISNTEIPDHNTHSSIRIGTAANVLLAIGRDSNTKISSFSTSLLRREGRISLSAAVENQGAHYSTLHPKVTIKNIFGKTVEVIDLGEHNLLAGKSKHFDIESRQYYYFGPYNASFSLGLQDNELNNSDESATIVLPGKVIIGVTVLMFLTLITYLRVRKKLKQTQL